MNEPQAPTTQDDLFVTLDGREHLVVPDVDHQAPFLLSVVSSSDHWLYASSRGGLTAGRRSPAGALFPYVTDDKLHTAHGRSGPLTTLVVHTPRGPVVWEPFQRENDDPAVRRHLYKTPLSDRVVFEEVHGGLGLTFRARWETSERFGFVRTVSLHCTGASSVVVDLADGVVDLMPAGVPAALQQGASCLVNAYTRVEVDPATGLGIVALQATIVDQPVAAEALTATVVAGLGLEGAQVLLSTDQLHRVRRGLPVTPEHALKGRRGSYLVHGRVVLEPGGTARWRQLADVERDHVQVDALLRALAAPGELDRAVDADVRQGVDALYRLVGGADGLMVSGDRRATAHHGANVLFNIMRGGVFADGHQVRWADVAGFLEERNRGVHRRHASQLPSGTTTVSALVEWARAKGDLDLERLAREYLPLFFSRRHGDPSRPWNSFEIRLRDASGARALAYEGNWRDIFQNWEALCASHPHFLEGVIVTFLDASTVDGFNPYRLTRGGVDWEVPEEGNPWSTIGYWGDHQLVYLGRLLESLERLQPGRLAALLPERWLVFADVPYRLASARAMAADPRNTITFDEQAHRRATERAAALGGDGRLVVDAAGAPVRASFLEKLLIPVLAKLANLVLDGGVWMNTQRPEWNDANNALVGPGVSVVTLCQLRRHLTFLGEILSRADGAEALVSTAVAAWLDETLAVLEGGAGDRRAVLDRLQEAFERYRTLAYAGEGRGSVPVPARRAARLCAAALVLVDGSIRANRRADGLWHSYNLLTLGPGTARLERLYEMLEGQVAVLSSGLLEPAEAIGVIDALFASPLYRDDQHSFLLYPERTLPGFLGKNRLPGDAAGIPLLAALLGAQDTRLVVRDGSGMLHFAGRLRTADDVARTLEAMAAEPPLAALVAAHRDEVVRLFEQVFDLASFTGRSGSMFGYEGLGCIYWHMVSKLLLAVQETHAAAVRSAASLNVRRALARAYHRVRDGLGFNKSPARFGAFPIDPYSHTPRHAGAQQPGMTGSVKEEILARWGELGIEVRAGRLFFEPRLLPVRELLERPATLSWYDEAGAARTREVGPGELAFTFCQVPIVYRAGHQPAHAVRLASGALVEGDGGGLDQHASHAILGRTGEVTEVLITVDRAALYGGELP